MSDESKKPIVLMPGEGRSYPMSETLSVVFKADRAETNDAYSISEWWLEPHTEGPGAHVHDDEDCIFSSSRGRRVCCSAKNGLMRRVAHLFAARWACPMILPIGPTNGWAF